MTAICFPSSQVDNEFPHMTLMIGGNWTPKLSNEVLIKTCKDANKFKLSYQECKSTIKEAFVQYADNISI